MNAQLTQMNQAQPLNAQQQQILANGQARMQELTPQLIEIQKDIDAKMRPAAPPAPNNDAGAPGSPAAHP